MTSDDSCWFPFFVWVFVSPSKLTTLVGLEKVGQPNKQTNKKHPKDRAISANLALLAGLEFSNIKYSNWSIQAYALTMKTIFVLGTYTLRDLGKPLRKGRIWFSTQSGGGSPLDPLITKPIIWLFTPLIFTWQGKTTINYDRFTHSVLRAIRSPNYRLCGGGQPIAELM